MHPWLQLRIGPFLALPVLIVIGLVAADALWTVRIHRHIRSQKPDSPPGYALGLAFGVWYRTVLVAIAGLFALYGSAIAFVLFSVGTIWRALAPGRDFVAGFLAGYEQSSGQSNPILASAVGAIWVVVTRGIPLSVLYAAMRAA